MTQREGRPIQPALPHVTSKMSVHRGRRKWHGNVLTAEIKNDEVTSFLSAIIAPSPYVACIGR
jgi:hypothetical protein